ncbi:aminopeptidase N [Candidatus Nitrosoglobus terrae]|uniref:Aminopeptidase N n=1 Tax=Candidatus Nitrosoglobus terrae TaxID=1630141 RepID=A0A1Q2SNJ4_9GAMM|nr:aminopeptidase N [Candidatus Nitrosoglobus terrae]BAW80673.1 aminopeptidase N [Candidatus Nitrosoglobus terrae]
MLETKNLNSPKIVYLKDYKIPDYQITTIDLHFHLKAEHTTIRSQLAISRYLGAKPSPLVLDSEELELLSIKLNGQILTEKDYQQDTKSLTLHSVPDQFTLVIETRIYPQHNTALSGLYISSNNFCTQCEAEGFRRITYFLDRPDIMARYTTTIVANKASYPVLLSNGNLIAHGDHAHGDHFAKWEDPFPKPSYLFALVAGTLSKIEDEFITSSGRKVTLSIYVQPHNIDKCEHAMASLKRAMAWDEQVYGREYDLDNYMIVAVDDFNMGAMENKGLNIFNSKYILAKPETATDTDYQYIEGVIGHEYFHNWSGNRVTCRDWFQLSLKEGFTVFRDQQFSASRGSPTVKRIQDVNHLRTYQFKEDSGPMAHPIRPESYAEINNFYTTTVYEKGAEVVRMLYQLLGPKGFRKGTDLYFNRHDGQAVTTDEFVRSLEDANNADFSQFRLWYRQAGTPELHASGVYDPKKNTYTLTVKQTCQATPSQSHKDPFHIPLALGLLDSKGNDLPLRLAGESTPIAGTRVMELRQAEEVFIFKDIPHKPIPSLLRNFSAPVKLHLNLSDEERCFLLAHDSNNFNRWEAGHQLAVKILLNLIRDYQQGKPFQLNLTFIAAIGKILTGNEPDKAFVTHALTLPSEHYLSEFMAIIDPEAIYQAHRFLRQNLAENLKDSFSAMYESLRQTDPYRFTPKDIGRRALRNTCLGYLMELNDPDIYHQCFQQFIQADNMTDTIAALSTLVHTESPERDNALHIFYEKWHQDPLVMDKWLSIQAISRRPDTLKIVKQLTQRSVFKLTNPNKVRALIGAFCQHNPVNFHATNGEGYSFLGDYILKLDPLNPQIAARLVSVFNLWRRYDNKRQILMKEQLERIANVSKISKDVQEIVIKSLN